MAREVSGRGKSISFVVCLGWLWSRKLIMKVDKEYLKELLEAFESVKTPLTNIRELAELGYDYKTDAFAFHSDILVDKGFIQTLSSNEKLYGAGYQLSSAGSRVWISTVPIRLTAAGHEFIDSLNEPNVWETIQANFKEASLDTIKSVALDLAKGYAKRKVKQILLESDT